MSKRLGKAIGIGALIGLCVAGGAVGGAVVQHGIDASAVAAHAVTAPRNSAYHNVLHIMPCIEEDSVNCEWNAGKVGNGEGFAFINYNGRYYYEENKAIDKALGW